MLGLLRVHVSDRCPLSFAILHGVLSVGLCLRSAPCCFAQDATLPTGGYTEPKLSLFQLLQTEPVLRDVLLNYARTGDSTAYRLSIVHAAEAGDIGAELMLGEEYIPEQCPHLPDRDMPNCGAASSQEPSFRVNSLRIQASYEDAIVWLKRASAQGSGEASEVLAQLITRMQANGHASTLGSEDSGRFHALARSQGFDVEEIHVHCYQDGEGKTEKKHTPVTVLDDRQLAPAMTQQELAFLQDAGVPSPVVRSGGMNSGDSVLLMRPQGPAVQVRVILDHRPAQRVLLPIPAHHDVVYVQQGEQFQAFPHDGRNIGRFVLLEPSPATAKDKSVFVYVQDMLGGYGGGPCASFSPRQ